jgi:mannonate dehydratase
LKYALGGSAVVSAAGLFGWHQVFDGPVVNPCTGYRLPDELALHPTMIEAFEGIDFTQLWDCHFHLLGNGENPSVNQQLSGAWVNPKMQSWASPVQKLQYNFYLNAACIENSEFADSEFLRNIELMLNGLPQKARFMLLAFDHQYDDLGKKNLLDSTFHIPNRYAASVANVNESFEWIASVHPYREDALEELDWCKKNGAKAIKWLPPAMNIDPSSSRCKPFYQKLKQLGMPLLTHAGDEKAVHSEKLQKLSNPLLLRTPLELGVKVIVAHCASLGSNEDLDSPSKRQVSNFDLFSRLMNDANYQNNCLADISAINLINREGHEIKQIIENQHWHTRLLYGSDYPLPGVMPVISSKKLVDEGLLEKEVVDFVNQVRSHNAWLYDFLVKRLMTSNGHRLSNTVFQTKQHFS